LLGPDFFSGWGVRTVGSREPRYNPISYHNGSVWPHDNALIASGLSKYGFKDLAGRILSELLDASIFVDLHRLPELGADALSGGLFAASLGGGFGIFVIGSVPGDFH
ncbi:MAG: hypothetical protein DMG71_00525, partial [Acidobacteria bacterium]